MIQVDKTAKRCTIKPGKDLVAYTIDDIKGEIQNLIDEKPDGKFIIDFTDVQVVDSMGIGILIAIHHTLREQGGSMKVINVRKEIYKAFSNMRLGHHFTIEPAPDAEAK